MRELLLLWQFAALIWIHWRYRAEPRATVEFLVDVGGPVMSKKDRAQLVADVGEEAAAGREAPSTMAILEAATPWFCRLDLPEGEEELWDDPPLFRRISGADRVTNYGRFAKPSDG